MSRLSMTKSEVSLTASIGENILLAGIYDGETQKLQNLYDVLNKFKLSVKDYMPKPRKDRIRVIYNRLIH